MTTREALLAEIRAAPADDLPRLVFADWLEENGEGDRASFIRLQCEAARLPGDGSETDTLLRHVWPSDLENITWDRLDPVVARRARIERRAEELLRRNKASWFGWQDDPEFLEIAFARGFPDKVTAHGFHALSEGLGSVLASAPLTRLTAMLSFAEEDTAGLIRSGVLRGLTRLDLTWGHHAGVLAALRRIGDSDQVGSVTALSLNVTDADPAAVLDALVHGRGWGRIGRLSLTFKERGRATVGLTAELLAKLVAAPPFQKMTVLSVAVAPGAEAVSVLARGCPGLEALDVGGLTPDAALALADTHLPELRSLLVSRTYAVGDSPASADPVAAATLITTSKFPKLAVLHMSDGAYQAATGLRGIGSRLVGTGRGPSLRFLGLQSAALGPDDVAALARCPAVRGLVSLELGSNPIGCDGIAAVAAEHWPRLANLYLPTCGIREAGAAALAGAKDMPELQQLWLSDNPLGSAGCAALTRNRLPQLRTLGLHDCGAEEKHLRQLRKRLSDGLKV